LSGNDPGDFGFGWRWRFTPWRSSAKRRPAPCQRRLLLILWLKTKPIDWRRLAQVVPFLAMGLGMGLVTVWWERFHQGTQGELFSMGLRERILVASHALWFYAGKLFWPVNLTFSYPRWTIDPAKPSAYGWLLMGPRTGPRRFILPDDCSGAVLRWRHRFTWQH